MDWKKRALADMARAKGVLAVVGTQARLAPEIMYLRDLVAEGYIGEVLSTSLTGTGVTWGGVIQQPNAYTLDVANGANLLTIPLGHTLAALDDVLGPIAELSAVLATRRQTSRIEETGESVPVTSPDQVLVAGVLQSGAPISIHYYGGTSPGDGLIWKIIGTRGELQLTGPSGNSQLVPLTLAGGRREDTSFKVLPLPAKYTADAVVGSAVVENVRRVYAAMASDLRHGTRSAPSFDDAVQTHQVIAAIERAAETGRSVQPPDL
jgi:predicted dehydrogenase